MTTFRRDLAGKLRTAPFELSPKAKWGDRMKHAAAVLEAFTLPLDPVGGMTACEPP